MGPPSSTNKWRVTQHNTTQPNQVVSSMLLMSLFFLNQLPTSANQTYAIWNEKELMLNPTLGVVSHAIIILHLT